jgi:hypothetical protein
LLGKQVGLLDTEFCVDVLRNGLFLKNQLFICEVKLASEVNAGKWVLNSFNHSIAILEFWQCRLLKLTTHPGKKFKKHCSDG